MKQAEFYEALSIGYLRIYQTEYNLGFSFMIVHLVWSYLCSEDTISTQLTHQKLQVSQEGKTISYPGDDGQSCSFNAFFTNLVHILGA